MAVSTAMYRRLTLIPLKSSNASTARAALVLVTKALGLPCLLVSNQVDVPYLTISVF